MVVQGQLTDDPTLDSEKLNFQWHVNVLGTIAVTRVKSPKITDAGRTIFIGSLLGSYVPFAGAACYLGRKTALVGYARSVVFDHGGRNITANFIQLSEQKMVMLALAINGGNSMVLIIMIRLRATPKMYRANSLLGAGIDCQKNARKRSIHW